MLHVEKLQPGFQRYNVIFYFKSKKGQSGFAQTSFSIESKGESRAVRLVTSNARAGNNALVIWPCIRGERALSTLQIIRQP